MYQAVYKCRICGGETSGCCTDSESTAMREIWNLKVNALSEQSAHPHMIETHHCKDGSIGVADFQGFKKIKEADEIKGW
jgi:hypothetical protein